MQKTHRKNVGWLSQTEEQLNREKTKHFPIITLRFGYWLKDRMQVGKQCLGTPVNTLKSAVFRNHHCLSCKKDLQITHFIIISD